jgi:hypothetical protein
MGCDYKLFRPETVPASLNKLNPHFKKVVQAAHCNVAAQTTKIQANVAAV